MTEGPRPHTRFDEELLAALLERGMPNHDPTTPPGESAVVAPPEAAEAAQDADLALTRAVEREQREHPGASRAPGAVTARNVFHHPEAHPLVLDLLLLRRYGAEYLEWERETLLHGIPTDFSVGSVSASNLEKIDAMRTLHLVATPWTSWEVTGWCIVGLEGIPIDPLVVQAPTVAMTAIAVDIFSRVRGDVAWSEEVLAYLGAVCRAEGVFAPPEPLEFVPIPAFAPIDRHAVEAAWPEVRRTGRAPTEETPLAEQLRRTLHVHRAVREARERLRAQLEILQHVA